MATQKDRPVPDHQRAPQLHAQDLPEVAECLQVKGRVLFPGAAMFEAARAAGGSLCAQKLVQDLALQDAVIPSPLMLQKPQVICPSSPAHFWGNPPSSKRVCNWHLTLREWSGSMASIAVALAGKSWPRESKVSRGCHERTVAA